MKEHVLILDDDVEFMEGVGEFLTQNKYFVHTFTNPFEAIEYLKTKTIHLAIVDLILPGKDGVDVIKEMKEINPELPILAVSAGPEYLGGDRKEKFRDNYLTMAKVSGAKKTLSKPFDLDSIIKEIEECLKQ